LRGLQDLIEQTGYFYGTPGRCLSPWEWHLLTTDTDDGLPTFLAVKTSVGILKRAFEQWGIENTLAFVRQGREGFDPEQTSDWREFVWGDQRKQVCGGGNALSCICTPGLHPGFSVAGFSMTPPYLRSYSSGSPTSLHPAQPSMLQPSQKGAVCTCSLNSSQQHQAALLHSGGGHMLAGVLTAALPQRIDDAARGALRRRTAAESPSLTFA
jgi:hypothetical protein